MVKSDSLFTLKSKNYMEERATFVLENTDTGRLGYVWGNPCQYIYILSQPQQKESGLSGGWGKSM